MGEQNNWQDEDTQEEEKNKHEVLYETFQNRSFVEEQPFYYKGMTMGEYKTELEYLNQNLSSFYDGSYMPLWKQTWLR